MSEKEMKKRRVLIVDDEMNIGILIQKLIHWKELGLELIDVLNNGEAALSKIDQTMPDIVLTDIKMPRIDGLELIKRCRDKKYHIIFIVISGYKEFEYAHKAIIYGVENYLLKPIQEEELNEALKKAIDKYERTEKQGISQKKLEEKVEEREKIIKQSFLKNILDQKNQDIEEYPLDFQGSLYRGIDIKLDYIDYRMSDEKQDEIVIKNVINIVEECLHESMDRDLICAKEYLQVYCLFSYNSEEKRLVNEVINTMLIRLQEYLIAMDQYLITIGVGREKNKFENIRFSILESYYAVCNRLSYGTGRLIYYEFVEKNNENNDSVCREEQVNHIKAIINRDLEGFQSQEICKSLREFFSVARLQRQETDMSVYYEIAEQFTDVFFNKIEIPQKNVKKQVLLKCINHSYQISQLSRLLIGTFHEVIAEAYEFAQKKSIKPVRFIEKYVEEHFSEKITLDDIAEILEMNSDYLSTLFKKETNMNFSGYVTNIRMEHAKKLLLETNDTIAAIGENVGYQDSKYFSQQFKKNVGVKPVVYRQLHS